MINNMIIALTGTPGTGKHTLAEKLSKKMNFNVIDLGKALRGRTTEKEVTVRDINSAFKRLKKDNSIIVSHLSHFIRSKDIKLIIVLRTDPELLAGRLKKRGYSPLKIYDNVMFEAIDGTYLEAVSTGKSVFQIDNSGGIGRCVEKAAAIIKGTGKGDSVDFSDKIIKIEKMLK